MESANLQREKLPQDSEGFSKAPSQAVGTSKAVFAHQAEDKDGSVGVEE